MDCCTGSTNLHSSRSSSKPASSHPVFFLRSMGRPSLPSLKKVNLLAEHVLAVYTLFRTSLNT